MQKKMKSGFRQEGLVQNIFIAFLKKIFLNIRLRELFLQDVWMLHVMKNVIQSIFVFTKWCTCASSSINYTESIQINAIQRNRSSL